MNCVCAFRLHELPDLMELSADMVAMDTDSSQVRTTDKVKQSSSTSCESSTHICNNASCAPIYCTFLNYAWSTATVTLHLLGLKPLVSCVFLLDFILLLSILAVLDTVEVLAEAEAVNLFIEQHKTNRCTCCAIHPDCSCLLCSDLLCKILLLSVSEKNFIYVILICTKRTCNYVTLQSLV